MPLQSKYPIVIAAIVVVVVVAGTIVLGWRYLREPHPRNQELGIMNQGSDVNGKQPETGNEVPGTSNQQLDTSAWKTYRNEEYGFEFKYPPDLVLCDLISGRDCTREVPRYDLGIKYKQAVADGPSSPTYCEARADDPRCEVIPTPVGGVAVDWQGSVYIRQLRKGEIILEWRNTSKGFQQMIRGILSTFKFIK